MSPSGEREFLPAGCYSAAWFRGPTIMAKFIFVDIRGASSNTCDVLTVKSLRKNESAARRSFTQSVEPMLQHETDTLPLGT